MSPQDRIPGEVFVKKGSEIEAPDGPQTDGMLRMPAIVDKSDQICGTGKLLEYRWIDMSLQRQL
jgi:hypothetical protein